jgi:Chaperone of endosialidase
MCSKIQLKRATPSLSLTAITLVCFAVASLAQAVVPAPDGGYPGGNTAEGQSALLSLTSGTYNTAVGSFSLGSNTDGSDNTAVGAAALLFNTGDSNTASGAAALFLNTTGFENTANGAFALLHNTEGSDNTANGASALFNNTTGVANTAAGVLALNSNTTGILNTAYGFLAGSNVTTANNVICIGHPGQNMSDSCYIGQIYTTVQPQVGTDPDYVTINSNGRLGRANFSSRRYKHDIQPMHTASEAIYQLKPVSFRYHEQYDRTQTIAFGLIAEEVAEVYPDLVGRNPKGEPESVRYEQINAMLLNEFLKEHATVQDLKSNAAKQEAIIVQQQKQIEALTAGLQKVSAWFESSKSGSQVVNNP